MFRAREVLLVRWPVERVLLERPLVRVELLRRFWLVVAMVLSVHSSADVRQLKVINSKDNKKDSREQAFENRSWCAGGHRATATATGEVP